MLDALLVAALCASTSLALPLTPPPDVAAHLSPRSNLTARAGEYTAIDSGDLVAQGYGNWRLASQRLLGKSVSTNFYQTFDECVVTVTGYGYDPETVQTYCNDPYYSRINAENRIPLANWIQNSRGPAECLFYGTFYGPIVGLSSTSGANEDSFCGWGSALLNGVSLSNTVGVELAEPCPDDYLYPPLPSCGGRGGMQTYYDSRVMNGALVSQLPTSWVWGLSNIVSNPDAPNTPILEYKVPMSSVTIKKCLTYCDSNGFGVAGLKGGNTCWCGSRFTPGNDQYRTYDPDPKQDLSCAGDASTSCGTSTGWSLYRHEGRFDFNFNPTYDYESENGAPESRVSVGSISAISTRSVASTRSITSTRSVASVASVASVRSVASVASALSVQAALSTASTASVGQVSVASRASVASVRSALSIQSTASVGQASLASLASLASQASVSAASVSAQSVASGASAASVALAASRSASLASRASVSVASRASVVSIAAASKASISVASVSAQSALSTASVASAALAAQSQASVASKSSASVAIVSNRSVLSQQRAASTASRASVSQASVSAQSAASAASAASVALAASRSASLASRASVSVASRASVGSIALASKASISVASISAKSVLSTASAASASLAAQSQASVASKSSASVAIVSNRSVLSVQRSASLASRASISAASVASVASKSA